MHLGLLRSTFLLQTLKNLKVFAKTNLSQIMVFNFGSKRPGETFTF